MIAETGIRTQFLTKLEGARLESAFINQISVYPKGNRWTSGHSRKGGKVSTLQWNSQALRSREERRATLDENWLWLTNMKDREAQYQQHSRGSLWTLHMKCHFILDVYNICKKSQNVFSLLPKLETKSKRREQPKFRACRSPRSVVPPTTYATERNKAPTCSILHPPRGRLQYKITLQHGHMSWKTGDRTKDCVKHSCRGLVS